MQLRRPKPLPTCTDEKGLPVQWSIDGREWEHLFAQSAQEAAKAIDDTKGSNQEAWQHAEQLGIQEESRARAIEYAQWSIASEKAALLCNGDEWQKSKASCGGESCKGSGIMPTLELKSMATKSSELAVEHSIWSLPSCLATAGNDLFSSLWAAIEGCLKATASAVRIDDGKGGTEQRQ